MPRMPFIGVRISWLMAARKRDLARLAASACLRASLQLRLGAAPLRDVAAEALHLGDAASPAGTACSSHSNQRGPAAVSISCT